MNNSRVFIPLRTTYLFSFSFSHTLQSQTCFTFHLFVLQHLLTICLQLPSLSVLQMRSQLELGRGDMTGFT